MPQIRIATFNVENLFIRPPSDRPRGRGDRRFGMFVFDNDAEALSVRRMVEAALSDDERQLTAQALLDCEADVVCLQEVEDESALELFRDEYLHRTLRPRVARELKAAHARVMAAAARIADPHARLRWSKAEMERVRLAAEGRHYYRHARVIEGNDARGIDVGFLSRVDVVGVASHKTLSFAEVPGAWTPALQDFLESEWCRHGQPKGKPPPTPQDPVFKRDCLKVDVVKDGAPLSLFICHFKSNRPFRARSHPLRLAEAKAVRLLVTRCFGPRVREANWVIAGDLNDYVEVDGSPLMPDLVSAEWQPSALTELLGGPEPFGFDVCASIAKADDRWTSYYSEDDVYSQLDHIIISPGLARRNPRLDVMIARAGQPWRATRSDVPRYPRVGWDRPKASDHCPIAVTLELG
jgi:endonuclease/exonuclease/phosphatase family metal-dependent hydrolase